MRLIVESEKQSQYYSILRIMPWIYVLSLILYAGQMLKIISWILHSFIILSCYILYWTSKFQKTSSLFTAHSGRMVTLERTSEHTIMEDGAVVRPVQYQIQCIWHLEGIRSGLLSSVLVLCMCGNSSAIASSKDCVIWGKLCLQSQINFKSEVLAVSAKMNVLDKFNSCGKIKALLFRKVRYALKTHFVKGDSDRTRWCLPGDETLLVELKLGL